MVYIYSNDEWFFNVNKKSDYKLNYNSAKLSGRGERYYKKIYKLNKAEKVIESGTQGRKMKSKKAYWLDRQQ